VRQLFLIVGTILVCTGCADMPHDPHAHAHSFGEVSRSLSQGMSESELVTLAGEPSTVSLTTCGTNTPSPWTCKEYRYNSSMGVLKLQVLLQRVNDSWFVVSWTAF